ncbi:MAG: VCBS repeat-containing protein, partial [Planctomycetaceae bacterium]|nr:VCBS repeat-containing protein [Planctomycetaceae bacterium]
MPDATNHSERRLVTAALCVAVVLIPAGSWWMLPRVPAWGPRLPTPSNGSTFPSTPLSFDKRPLDEAANPPPWITNCQIIDLDGDGLQDVLACDARWNRVVCHYQESPENWRTEVLGTNLIAPAHATVVDLDGDGDRDVLVSVLGSIWPSDDVIGRVVWLEKTDAGFESRVLLTDVRRVADVQPGDFDD